MGAHVCVIPCLYEFVNECVCVCVTDVFVCLHSHVCVCVCGCACVCVRERETVSSARLARHARERKRDRLQKFSLRRDLF